MTQNKFQHFTLRRAIWCAAGVVLLVLGTIGVLLPVLPTTPFVILAAFAFAKGSPALAQALEGHKTFGPIIRDWRANGAIALRYKIAAHLMMLAALILSVVLQIPPHFLAVQTICLIGASLFILSRPTCGPSSQQPDHSPDQAGNHLCEHA